MRQVATVPDKMQIRSIYQEESCECCPGRSLLFSGGTYCLRKLPSRSSACPTRKPSALDQGSCVQHLWLVRIPDHRNYTEQWICPAELAHNYSLFADEFYWKPWPVFLQWKSHVRIKILEQFSFAKTFYFKMTNWYWCESSKWDQKNYFAF